MHERVFLADIPDGKGNIRFAKGEIYGPYPVATWNDIARVVGKPLEKFAKRVEDQARDSLRAVTGGKRKKRRA